MHIQALLVTLKNTLFKPLLEAGKIYVALPPLYRATRAGKPPIYLQDEKALDAFYVSELKNNFSFIRKNKVVNDSTQIKYVGLLRKFSNKLKLLADEYSFNPHILEAAFIQSFNEDGDLEKPESIWNLDKKRIKFNNTNGKLSVNGFFQVFDSNKTLLEEEFISLNSIDLEKFVEEIFPLVELFNEIMELDINIKYKENVFEEGSIFNTFTSMEKRSQNYTILRFKGLGEANASELEPTLNPDTRTLIKLISTDRDDECIKQYMGKESSFKKDLVQEKFKEALDLEGLDI